MPHSSEPTLYKIKTENHTQQNGEVKKQPRDVTENSTVDRTKGHFLFLGKSQLTVQRKTLNFETQKLVEQCCECQNEHKLYRQIFKLPWLCLK